jgi:hypothetical protein
MVLTAVSVWGTITPAAWQVLLRGTEVKFLRCAVQKRLQTRASSAARMAVFWNHSNRALDKGYMMLFFILILGFFSIFYCFYLQSLSFS